MWLEIMTYNLSRTIVTNKVVLIVGYFIYFGQTETLKCRVFGPEPFIKRGIAVLIINYHQKFMFLKVYILVLAVTFKHYAKLHASGCGHFSEKSCQLSVSINSKATREKQNGYM